MFTLENLIDCLKQDFKKSMHYLLGPLLIILTCTLSAYLGSETYRNEFVIFHLLHSLCFNVTEYRLMVANMTKSEFKFYGWENIFSLMPLVVGASAPGYTAKVVFEPFVSYICVFGAYLLFYVHIFFLAN